MSGSVRWRGWECKVNKKTHGKAEGFINY